MTEHYVQVIDAYMSDDMYEIDRDIPRVKLPRGFVPPEILEGGFICGDIGTIQALSNELVYWMKREESRYNYSYALRHAIELYEFINAATRKGHKFYEIETKSIDIKA